MPVKRMLCFGVFLLAQPDGALGQEQDPDRLMTPRGWEIAGQASYYQYEEPSIDMRLWGPRVGLAASFTSVSEDKVFFRIDGRYSYGSLAYEGTGERDGVPDSTLEARSVLGKDFRFEQEFSVAPYFGLGYRFLYNDLRGTTSTGAVGYRRYSQYLYVPLGLTLRASLGSQWVMAPTIEYDYFIAGAQVSRLSDTNLGFSDARNRQDKGYGYRLSLMLEKSSWAFGPWMHYWHIEDSDIVSIGQGVSGLEPRNETRETGFEVRYRF